MENSKVLRNKSPKNQLDKVFKYAPRNMLQTLHLIFVHKKTKIWNKSRYRSYRALRDKELLLTNFLIAENYASNSFCTLLVEIVLKLAVWKCAESTLK